MSAALPVEASMPKTCPSCGTCYAADALFCCLDGAPLTTPPGAVAAAAKSDAYVGQEILGHIEIRQLVGIGAMGRVYRAFQKGIDRDVAVKILHRELSANQTVVARFHREAKVASRLAHPNVVHVLLVGQLPDGAMYIVMEYLDGVSLQGVLCAAEGTMTLPRALRIALQICDAVGEAHAHGIVHRDIKPENVMLVTRADDPDYVKVLDFGIARLDWGDPSMATAAGLIFGTARYISPEGARGEAVGPQGDVYSIATLVYQMVAGRPPFDGDQAVALLVQQIHDPPPPLKSIEQAASVPEPIAAVVMANLAKKPEERAPSARAFGRALLEAALVSGLSAQDILARPALSGTGDPQGSGTSTRGEAPAAAKASLGGTEQGSARVRVHTAVAAPCDLPGSARCAPTARGWPHADFEANPAPPALPSGVDVTMDDQQDAVALAAAMPSAESAAILAMIRTTAPVSSGSAASRTAPTAPPRTRAQHAVNPAQSCVEAAQAGAEPCERRPATRLRSLRLVVAWFLLGALGMGAFAFRARLIGRTRSAVRLMMRTGDRAGAVVDARARPPANLRDRSIEVPPPATQGAVPPAIPAASPVVPPLLPTTPLRVGTPVAPHRGNRVVLEVSNAKPGVAESVDFTARVLGPRASSHPRVVSARFQMAGPGIAPGTELAGSEDGQGVYRASFAFMLPGPFEVTFSAQADGGPVRADRALIVGSTVQGNVLPPAVVGAKASPSAVAAPAPAPSSSAPEWL